ncbi:MAG: hypothetical protein K2X25_14260 [Caulobacteraceae bacterium]|nr:hypothetical protein [Caulobacteraceae bacterium]
MAYLTRRALLGTGPSIALSGVTGRRVDLLVRFGYAPDLPFSLRRPAAAVLRSRDL